MAMGSRAVPVVMRRATAAILQGARRNPLHLHALVSLLVILPDAAQVRILRLIAYDRTIGFLTRLVAVDYLSKRGLEHPRTAEILDEAIPSSGGH